MRNAFRTFGHKLNPDFVGDFKHIEKPRHSFEHLLNKTFEVPQYGHPAEIMKTHAGRVRELYKKS